MKNTFSDRNNNLVSGGYAAIKFNKLLGVVDTVYGPGTHLKWPFFESPVLFETRAKPRAIPTLTGSKGSCNTRCEASLTSFGL